MTRVKLNLVSGNIQERELVTAFKYQDVKYLIFDGEATGQMGLPIILVSKEAFGKVVGITDAEEWKNTKECLKKIIAGETVDYIKVESELNADDIYYRQLTLPIASFDLLKSSYKEPEGSEAPQASDDVPVFQPISPEEVSSGFGSTIEPVSPQQFNTVTPVSPITAPVMPEAPVSEPSVNTVEKDPQMNVEALKAEFLDKASKLFDEIFEKFNH